jgi:alpha-L-fucosidase
LEVEAFMQRREFCKLMAAAAAAALPIDAQKNDAAPAPAVNGPGLNGFDELSEDYAAFCATPADQRVFYELQNGQFIKEHLDDAAWQVSPNSESGPEMPPSLPVPGGSWNGVPMIAPVAGLEGDGPYKATWDSLLQYEAPEWYRDAKFGIWAHWSPQCVPEAGDWYARNMYMQGSDQYNYHVAHYGHPSKFGFKDLCPQWTLLNWEPDALMARYKKAGARFFLALANHHDNFDAWNSRHNPWNAINIGPHRDVVGDWAATARKQGMRFGVTVHQPRNWWWLQTAHGADATGPLAGVPYDGLLTAPDGRGQWWQGFDPQQLYAPKHPPMALPDASYVKNFYDRTRDLVDQHDPDLLYLDNALLPLGWGGMNATAYFYNRSLETRGRMEGVVTTKQVPDRLAKAVVADIERGVTSGISTYPWQSETCIGGWHYDRKLFNQAGEYGGYQNPRDIIHWLIDTVSKNGTFILNIPGRPDGTIDSKEIAVLDKITEWIEVNGEAIYETRPWKVFGEGPEISSSSSSSASKVNQLGPKDIRFTRNKSGTAVYAMVLGWPEKEVVIRALGTASPQSPARVAKVEWLGCQEKVKFRQIATGLHLQPPAKKLPEAAISLKIGFA